MIRDFKKLKKKKARLAAITAVDEKNLIYHFLLDNKLKNIRVKVNEGVTQSITKLFPNAEFYEREIFETFGIKFKGNKNLKHLFLREDVKTPMKG